MQISVIGCGYLGAVHAASMAELGHDVVGIDVNAEKVALLNAGKAPFHEPGFDELLERNVTAGRLRFSADFADVAGARVHFIGVGTPQQAGSYAADMSQVNGAVAGLVPHLAPTPDGPVLVVGKSTVPVGTAAGIAEQVTAAGGVLMWNPEFLREGFAVQDTISPDRMVYGLSPDPEAARIGQEVLDEVYDNLINNQGIPRLLTDYATAELVKVAANSFLATKISFINAMAELCEATGADVTQLAAAIGHDDRIGHKFLRAGVGFGGGCLPKDIRAFMARAEELGVDEALGFLREVDSINDRRR
ncbi:UDP-glucose dehydrogenase family protein, partial [Georgenia satyanarayanai]